MRRSDLDEASSSSRCRFMSGAGWAVRRAEAVDAAGALER